MTIPILKRELSADEEMQLIAYHEADVAELLPVVGPLFGVSVVLFSLWDYMVDPAHAGVTVVVRIAFTLAGMLALLPGHVAWAATRRAGYMYWMYTSAIVISEFILKNGFAIGLAGITAGLFTVSVTTLNGRSFLATLSVPALLFVTLTAISLPAMEFANGLTLYFFCACLAYILMRTIRYFRQKAFVLQAELTALSRSDSLTGVYRRGYLAELAGREISLANRSGRPLAAAMLDIDNFKRINDTYGHDIGDKVIQLMARICMASLRSVDHFGRVGGEEFVCVLPETTPDKAAACAERLRRNVEDAEVDVPGGPLKFTVSIGVAMYKGPGEDWNALLKNADTALYQAKREGKNRVVIASSTALPD